MDYRDRPGVAGGNFAIVDSFRRAWEMSGVEIKKGVRVIALGAVAALFVSALVAAPTSSAEPTAETSTTASRSDSTTDRLRWRECTERDLSDSVRCSFLRVPRNWAEPENPGTYRISVARIRATGPRIGVLTFNTGGPGGEGVRSIDSVHEQLPHQVRRSFDLVAWDPRGVGGSEPALATCRISYPELPASGPVDVESLTAQWVDALTEANQSCLELNRAHADNVGTWQVIRDLDALRAALGERQLTFWGMSYGSTVGRGYAQAFPERVRALLLDGAIDPAPSINSYMREHIWSDVTGVNRMLGALGSSYTQTYLRAMRYLDKRTLRFPGGRVITRWNFVIYLSGSASYQSAWPDVTEFLDRVRQALNSNRQRTAVNGAELIALMTSGEAVDPLVPAQGWRSTERYDPLFAFVNCSDMHDRPTTESIALVGQQAKAVGGTGYLLPPMNEGAACSGLPRLGTALPGLHSILRISPRPVIVNAVGDNRTPYQGARELANVFARAPMVLYDGTQHVSYGRVSECINAPVTRYLLTQVVPAQSVACPLEYSGR